MGEASDRMTAPQVEPREEARRIDAELEQLRDELSLLADELDRRRLALDPRFQLRRHPVKGVLAGGVLGVVGGLAVAVVRRRARLHAGAIGAGAAAGASSSPPLESAPLP